MRTLDVSTTLDRAVADTALEARHFEGQGDGLPLLVVVHGSGWYEQQFDALGARLSAAGIADVLAPDLRGHGPKTPNRGDVAYPGRFEDDLADFIGAVAKSVSGWFWPGAPFRAVIDTGEETVVPDAGHLEIVDHDATFAPIADFPSR